MKKLISICLLLFFISNATNATNYYFSSTGSDGNAGTSTGAPWQTLTKFNSYFSSLAAGDSVLFKRGDVFDGTMTISKSGSAGSPIKISAYGTGAKPIINGFTTVNSWVNIAAGVWESSAAVSALSTMNMVTLNGVSMAMGRYPKTSYLTYQSGTNGTITSSGISGASSFVGGEVYVRFNRWSADRCVITGQSSTVVTYTPQSGFTPTANYGFFFENHPNTLTQTGTTLGEWYYDPSTNKIRMYFGGGNPASYTVKVSSNDKLVTAASRSYITFDNLAFQGGNTNAFYVTSGTNDIIQNCDILFTGKNAIEAASTTGFVVNGNYIDYSHTAGIEAGFQSGGATITNNNVRHTAMFPGMAWKKTNDDILNGIRCQTAGSNIQYNTVFAAGFMGIRAHVSNGTTVQNNYVDSTCFVKDDGGGIYTWASGSSVHSNFQILNNVVLNSIGATAGTSSGTPEGEGIYLDDNSDHVTVSGNTVYNTRRAIFLHNTNNIIVSNNTAFDNQYGLRTTMDGVAANTLLTITGNIFFARTATEAAAYFKSTASTLNLGTLNSNYYCRPILETTSITTDLANVGTDRTLAGWKTFSGQDASSNVTTIPVTNASQIRFEYNETAVSKNVALGANYVGVSGTAYSGTISIPAYSSLILLQTAASACPTGGVTSSGTYYFSTLCGDDNRTATQARNPSTPWKTVAKLNSYFPSMQPGDSALFNRGETFPGGITVGRSGTSGSPIVIGAYGTGNDPVLTQMTSVTSWTALGGNIYETPGAISTLATLDMVTVNGVPVGKGRYPNDDATNGGYLNITGVTGTTAITVASLPTTTNYTGAEVVIRSTHYQLDRSLNISHNTSTHVITYTSTSGTTPVTGFGCWIQNSASTLDQQGEWFYNTSTKKLRMYSSTGTPSGVAVATGTNLVTSTSRSDVKFDNITFSGCNGDNVSLSGGSRITFQNCTVKNSGKAAFQVSGTKHATIQSDTLLNNLDLGVHLINSSHGAIVKDNYIRNTAIIPGLMQTDANHGTGILMDATNDTVLVQGNSVINSGSAGINFRGSDSLWIKNNLVDTFCLVIDDIGGIYGYLGGTTPVAPGPLKTIRIRGNVVRNGIGAQLGTPSTGAFANSAYGLYWDNTIGNIYCDSNHVVNGGRAAVYFHYLTHHITMRANSLYNTQYLVYVSRSSTQDITNNTFKNNILWTTGTQKAYWYENFTSSTPATFGTIDSNNIVYLTTNTTPFTIHSNATGSINYTLSGWKATGRDVKSDTLTTLTTSTVREDFAAAVANVVALGGYSWLDAKKTFYANTRTYKPFRGGVLKRWQLVGLQPPVVSITLPASGATFATPGNITINATATDADGIISQVQFYNGATLLNTDVSNPYSFNWTGVAAGTYTLTAKATDNDNLVTTSAPITITVANIKPTVSITSPPAGQVYTAPATVVIAATASDANGTIARVDFFNGPTFLGSDNTSPYSYTWNNVPVGGYNLTVVGVDNDGDSTTSAAKAITVSAANTPPTINITAPANGYSSTNTSVTLTAVASDNGTITSVKFYDGTTLLNNDITAPYSYSKNFSIGVHTIRATAKDNTGDSTTSAPITITILAPNVKPTVSITFPTSGTSYTEPASYTITATAADADGTIARVNFYKDGGVFIGTDVDSPYTVTRTGILAGGYSYKAVAVDNNGDSTTSAAISVIVVVDVYVPPDTLSAVAAIITPIACAGGTAFVTVTATGGLEPYTGDIGDHTETAGLKTYIVTDANGLKDTVLLSVYTPGVLSVTVDTGSAPIAVYLGSKVITVAAIGGTGAFQYKLNSGLYQSSASFTVKAGTYTATVLDSHGCTATSASFSIAQPAAPPDVIIHGKGKHIYQ